MQKLLHNRKEEKEKLDKPFEAPGLFVQTYIEKMISSFFLKQKKKKKIVLSRKDDETHRHHPSFSHTQLHMFTQLQSLKDQLTITNAIFHFFNIFNISF